MASRTGNNSARGSGGLNAGGFGLDTFLTFTSSTPKQILTISWSYGANGSPLPAGSLPLWGRLVVLDGVAFDPTVIDAQGSPYLARGLAIGQDITPPYGIFSQGGNPKFDVDLCAGGSLPLSEQYLFPSDNSDGALLCVSGSLTVALFAPFYQNGNPSPAVGKLIVQFKELVTGMGALPDYSYAKNSPSLIGG